ncbi:uncharacterized protein N7459_003920 [Penicillium hispanicum]|uniref:uncharacterized protein n=1 Tax=Penicillium hispanicum TaxID=1080232 RepID=UPI0025402244|nr:uncharacterized protein N7459_003920 [Penicillium hispanicum]KAJ5584120.1 hypothetical protein N7459_003920 [Penicillium hispanicum]
MDASAVQKDRPPIASFVDRLITGLADFKPQLSTTDINELDSLRPQGATQEKQHQSPLSGLPAPQLTKVKPLMLTLHCIFPNELLPALDILDRRLVQRFVRADRTRVATATADEHDQVMVTECPSLHQAESDKPLKEEVQDAEIFLVASASTAPPHQGPGVPPSTSTTQEPEKGYEVRLHAWNCTCPTFALSAFRDLRSRLDPASEYQTGIDMLHNQDGPSMYPFGGTLACATDKGLLPVCKHILACILFARCPGLFGRDGDGRRLVSVEELAGWCAGWGG